MTATVSAMTQIGPNAMELREYAMPEVPVDGGIVKMEAVGICGSDVAALAEDPESPRILGHENVGRVDRLGSAARHIWGLEEGELVALEEYLVCHQCEWCHQGEYRHCWKTDVYNNSDPLRYGSTPTSRDPGLWGGYSQYLYMPDEAVWHRVPAGVTAAEACLHIALGNGVQWAVVEGGAGPGKSVFIQGPGQMGCACVVAARAAGADLVIVTGLSADAERLEVCRQLGADVTIDIGTQDVRQHVHDITGGKGVDIAVDTTSATNAEPTLTAIDVLRRRGGTMVVQGGRTFESLPTRKLSDHYITLKQACGHSYASVERGLQIIASRRFPLHLIHTHDLPLARAREAVGATVGEPIDGDLGLHVAILPWS